MAEASVKMEEDVRVLRQPIGTGVHLANRLDLHRLAAFVETHLPHRSDVMIFKYFLNL